MMNMEYHWHTDTLVRMLAGIDQLPHALLLSGTPGIGKSRFAAALANALLCESAAPDRRSCGQCAACGWFRSGNHPDYRLLEPLTDDDGKASREIRIDQVRALADFVNVGGHRSARRVVQLDPADALNTPAANALLKTLEEPPAGVLFLLVSSRSDALPATIRSRCQVRLLEGPSMAEASAWLQGETGCSPQDAGGWLAMAGGSPLAAARFAEPAQAAAHRALLEAIARLPDTSSVAVADALHAADARQWLPLLQRWVMDLGRRAAGAEPRYFPGHAARLAELARRTSSGALAQAGRALAGQFRQVDHPLNARLFCEESLEVYLGAFTPETGGAGATKGAR